MSYIGRLPSPSGPSSFGSLVAALGSYFQAKSHQGQWLVRMEDLDPPREMVGAAELILKTLEAYHLFWDGDQRYQSQRHDFYQAQIDTWVADNQAYCANALVNRSKPLAAFILGLAVRLNSLIQVIKPFLRYGTSY